MAWSPPTFTKPIEWQDSPSAQTALDAANLIAESNGQAAYAVAAIQSYDVYKLANFAAQPTVRFTGNPNLSPNPYPVESQPTFHSSTATDPGTGFNGYAASPILPVGYATANSFSDDATGTTWGTMARMTSSGKRLVIAMGGLSVGQHIWGGNTLSYVTSTSRKDSGCTTTSSSPTVLDANCSSLDLGQSVGGTNIPSIPGGARIGNVVDGVSFDIVDNHGVTHNATASGTVTLTIGSGIGYSLEADGGILNPGGSSLNGILIATQKSAGVVLSAPIQPSDGSISTLPVANANPNTFTAGALKDSIVTVQARGVIGQSWVLSADAAPGDSVLHVNAQVPVSLFPSGSGVALAQNTGAAIPISGRLNSFFRNGITFRTSNGFQPIDPNGSLFLSDAGVAAFNGIDLNGTFANAGMVLPGTYQHGIDFSGDYLDSAINFQSISMGAVVKMGDGNDITFGTISGGTFGTDHTQKMSLWDAPPTVQPGSTSRTGTCTATAGSHTVNDAGCVAADAGQTVTCSNVLPGTWVGTVIPGVSFTLVNSVGAFVNASGSGSAVVTIGANYSPGVYNAGTGTALTLDGTFVGALGSTPYTLDQVVTALKATGALKR